MSATMPNLATKKELLALTECDPNQNKNDNCTKASASKFACAIRCDEASEKIIHVAFNRYVVKTLCHFKSMIYPFIQPSI
jgi:hypothetical protein